MSEKTGLRFWKLQGCGNSFIICADLQARRADWPKLGPKLMHPHFGIGSDGLLVVRPSARADFEVLMYNPDGTAMGMCGNGLRCVARFLVLEKLMADPAGPLHLDAAGRPVTCRLFKSGRWVEVDMGPPSWAPADIPLAAPRELIDGELEALGQGLTATALSMGNPHCVIFVSDLDSMDCRGLGARLEKDPFFPQRTNVGFVQVIAPDSLRMKVWERGAGMTLACGSGACAALAAGVKTGRCARQAEIHLPGGRLEVRWDGEAKSIFLSGPAEEICRGEVAEDFFHHLEYCEQEL